MVCAPRFGAVDTSWVVATMVAAMASVEVSQART